MALADYYKRGAVAASQVLSGFNEVSFRQQLEGVSFAVAVSDQGAQSSAGRSLSDLVVRLAARLYPALLIQAPGQIAQDLIRLARAINPAIDILDAGQATVGVGIGRGAQPAAESRHYAGATAWSARVSRTASIPVARSDVPFGAGVAACLVMGNVFNEVFTGAVPAGDLEFPVLPTTPAPKYPSTAVLVGAGAIGHAVAWALARWPAAPKVEIVDPEPIDLGNLQRYALASRRDVERRKVDVLGDYLPKSGRFIGDWAQFVADRGYGLELVLACLDSASARVQVQASLPRWVINAWTQPGDLGVSAHRLDSAGACLSCLYLPSGSALNEDVIYAQALGIFDQLMAVRSLLYTNSPVPEQLLQLIAQRLQLDVDAVMAFANRPIRQLYREGLCGGALLPLGSLGSPRQDVHVPLAHQSALAGVLAAARAAVLRPDDTTLVTRVNVLGPINPAYLTQPAAKDPRGICICQDPDYVATYRAKHKVPRRRSTSAGGP